MTMNAFITGAFDTDGRRACPAAAAWACTRRRRWAPWPTPACTLADIDGVLCAYSFTEPHLMLASVFCEYMGIHPGFCAAIQAGGASACIMVMQAAALVASGQCSHVLVVTGDNRLTGMSRDGAVAALAEVGHPQFERPFGISVPASYALVARRYMHETGATPEQLAAIAVEHRQARSASSEGAQARADHDRAGTDFQGDRLASADAGLLPDLRRGRRAGGEQPCGGPRCARAGRWKSSGPARATRTSTSSPRPSLTDFGCKASSTAAFGRAGVTAADIDVAEIYDSFTITLAVELESIGFFERGEAGSRGRTRRPWAGWPPAMQHPWRLALLWPFWRGRRHVPRGRGRPSVARARRCAPGEGREARLRARRRRHPFGPLLARPRSALT